MTSPPIQLDLVELEKEQESLAKRSPVEQNVLLDDRNQNRTRAKISDNQRYCILTSLISRRAPALDVTEKDMKLAYIMQKNSPQKSQPTYRLVTGHPRNECLQLSKIHEIVLKLQLPIDPKTTGGT